MCEKSPPSEIGGNQEVFDQCVRKLHLAEFDGYSAARAEFGGTYVYITRQHHHYGREDSEKIGIIYTRLEMRDTDGRSFTIRTSVMSPLRLMSLRGVVGVKPSAISVSTEEQAHETEVKCTASGRVCSVKGDVFFPDTGEEAGDVLTMIIDDRWVLEIPSYDVILENIGSGDLGVVINDICKLDDGVADKVLEFVKSPDWEPIKYDLSAIEEV